IEEKGFQSKDDVEALVKSAKDELETTILAVKKSAMKEKTEKKTFGELLGDSLSDNKETLSGLASKNKVSGSIMLKADEDMNPGNFGTGAYDFATTDRTRGMYEFPFTPLWLRNVLPNTSTTGSTIQ